MKILFVGFWGLDDPLTLSTTFPNLELLAQMPHVEHIRLATVERDGYIPALNLPFQTDKISYQPLVSAKQKSLLYTKIEEFIRFPKELAATVRELEIDAIIGRGAMAGALAFLVSRRTGVPFYVESFEPHADYMLDSGVWKRYDPRYIFQRYWEEKEKKFAVGLMPVAENYRRKLITDGIDAERIVTVPCPVNLNNFAYSADSGRKMRERLGFSEHALVGIYVGKFGDIYYDAEAFDIFREAADFFGADFRLIILTPNPIPDVTAKLKGVGLREETFFVTKAPHHEVPAYLSAADFAFAPIKPAECRQYCSPVKVGEYWANGLPVLLTEGVGDDSDIIKQEGGGAIFDLKEAGSVQAGLHTIAKIINHVSYRQSIRELAVRHRSLELSRQAYHKFFAASANVVA